MLLTACCPPCPAHRKPLDQRFAVLLMRSSYEAVDQLDFIPMVGGSVGWRLEGGTCAGML